MKSVRTILGAPALHVLVGGFYTLVFVWPFIAFNRPVHVFCFLVGAWGASILTAFLLSRGQDDSASGGGSGGLDGGLDDNAGDLDV